jgi:hypothetical protein
MSIKNIIGTGLIVSIITTSLSCTKLDPVPYSVVTSEVFWSDPAQAANAVAPVYSALNGFANGENMRLANATGGEIVDPRNFGGGAYLERMWKHTWSAGDGSLNQMWNTFYRGVTSANFIMSQMNALDKNKPADIDKLNAHLKVMRAFFLYHAMDNFGRIPLDTSFNSSPASIKSNTRQEAFNFIEKELLQNIPLLDNKSNTNYGRANRQVGYTLLAQLYINAQVYTGTPRWADAIRACDSVINSGFYRLSPNYFNNFAFDNHNYKDENILVAPKDKVLNNFPGMMETIHPNGGRAVGITGSPWNGFCATADMYNKYNAEDKRIRQWLVGIQRDARGTRVIDDNYNPGDTIFLNQAARTRPLSYNLNVVSFNRDNYANADSFDMAGARNVKYYPEQGSSGADMGNDLVMMRLADVILMKVEAEFRLNGRVTSVALFNSIRERAYGNASHNIASPTLDDIYNERRRELMWEGYSRRDGIRFEVAMPGTKYFSAARAPGKSEDPADGHRRVFPIPAAQLSANTNLTQNPGYN